MSAIPSVTILTLATALALGLLLAMLSRLKSEGVAHPERATHSIGWLLFLLNLLLLPLMLLAGILVDMLGVRPVLIFASILLSLCLLGLSGPGNYWRTLVIIPTAALGAAVYSIVTLILLSNGLFGREESAASLQFGLVVVALAALSGVPLFDLLQQSLGRRRSLFILAFFQLLPAFLCYPFSEKLYAADSLEQIAEPLSDPAVWAVGFILFAYAPLEAFISVWTASYLDRAGESQLQSRWVAWFWLGMIGSRLVLALFLHISAIGDVNNSLGLGGGLMRSILVLLSLTSAVVLGNLIGAVRMERALMGLIVLGIFLGPIYPLLLGLALRLETMRAAPLGSCFALGHLAGSLGSLILLPLVGVALREQSMRSSLFVALVLALVVAAGSLLFGLLAQTSL